MSQKVRKTLIMIVMAALIICLMAASLTYTFTYGRYTGKDFDAENSPYDDLIEFVGANQYLVYSPEELIQAIKDGYSNIQIADEAEQPFVITEGVTDVTANLVLDVNGKTLIRNSRNPMLDVQTNVSVVLIYDSSDDEQGGFYNPVGSALQASGGTLTVGSGNYDDGPKGTDSTSVVSQSTSATLVTRGTRTATKYDTPKKDVTGLPKITANHYFAEGDEEGDETATGSFNPTYIKPDTFLILTYEDDCELDASGNLITGVQTEGDAQTGKALTVPCNAASCDFYYYYEVGDNPTTTEKETDTYAVVYGYNDVKALARDDLPEGQTEGVGMATALKEKGLIWPYAAVRMEEGEGFARGGTFSNHFDAVNTYGIYAEGGTLTASGANFTTGGDGVCIRCEGSASLSIGGGTYSSEIGNTIEMVGGKMTVTAGKFTKDASSADTNSTDNGSAIDIQGGTLNMAGAETAPVSFTVTGNYVNGVRVGDPTTSTVTETATIENAVFNFNKGEGSNSVAGVRSFGGTLTVRSSTFNISNGATSGKTITRAAGLSTQGGTVMATACIFNFAQENATVFPTASAGISSLGGTVTATDSTFTIPGNNNYGIYSSITSGVTGENQYDTKAANCTFTMTGNSNHGIYAAGGKTLASGGTITLIGSGQNSDNFGIYSQSGTTTAEGCTITITGTYSAGALSYNGTIYLNDNTVIKVTESGVSTGDNTLLTSSAVSSEASTSGDHPINMNGNVTITSDGLGITARGNINVQSGKTTITTERATGIYVQGGILTVLEKAVVEVNSEIDSTCSWVVPPEHTDDESLQTNIYNGVFVNGGSLISNGTLNVTFTGVQNDAYGKGQNANWTAQTAYQEYIVKSYAVCVEGGAGTDVLINNGKITNQIGGGLYVTGVAPETIYDLKNQTFEGLQNTEKYTLVELENVTIEAQGCDPNGFTDGYIDGFDSNWNYKFNTYGGHAVEVDGGIVGIKNGTYSAEQGDGIRVQNGMVFLEGGSFTGRDQYENNEGGLMPGAAASYAFKVYGGSVKVTGGTFGSQSVVGSGAFVMEGTAYITAATIQAGGTTGFSAWTDATVTFAPAKDDDIQVTADSTGLAVENGGTYPSLSVTIEGGTFQSTNESGGNKNGIWYGNGNAKLTITGGQFTGSDGSGLFFGATPNTIDGDDTIMIVQISGGRFEGNPVRDGWSSNYSSGAIAGVIGSRWDPRPGYSIGVNYILRIGTTISSSGWGNGEPVQDGDGSSKWNDAIQETLASCSWIEIS